MFSKLLHHIPKNPSSSVSISGGHENDVEVTGFRFFTLPFFVLDRGGYPVFRKPAAMALILRSKIDCQIACGVSFSGDVRSRWSKVT